MRTKGNLFCDSDGRRNQKDYFCGFTKISGEILKITREK
jgi:hypothetical protein